MRIAFIYIFLLFVTVSAFAQPPVTNGLKLYLDATKGFNSNGSSAATWQDQSLAGNHLTAGNASLEPTFTVNAAGAGFPGIQFKAPGAYMSRLYNNTNGFGGTTATLFVVRIANTANSIIGNPTAPPSAQAPSLLSIGQKNSFNNEFALLANWGLHSTSSGNWAQKNHNCFSSLPDDKPVVLAAVLNTGTGNPDIDYYVNGTASTLPIVYQSGPKPYVAEARSIIIGGRYDGTQTASPQANAWFEGYILEVLAYDRILSNTEIDDVNKYLKCKYQVKYTSCNIVPDCGSTPGSATDTVISIDTCEGVVFKFGKYTISKSGIYTDTFKTATGKDSVVRLNFTVFARPQANFMYKALNNGLPQTINFTNLSTGANSYVWTFGDGETDTEDNPAHVYSSPGTYTVCLKATNSLGCTDETCKELRIPIDKDQPPVDTLSPAAIDIPNGFSPNGDGKNDILFVYGFGIKKMHLRIYNRWGYLIFESTDPKKGWDGNYSGMAQDIDVVAYVLDADLANGEKFHKTGNITIMR